MEKGVQVESLANDVSTKNGCVVLSFWGLGAAFHLSMGSCSSGAMAVGEA